MGEYKTGLEDTRIDRAKLQLEETEIDIDGKACWFLGNAARARLNLSIHYQ